MHPGHHGHLVRGYKCISRKASPQTWKTGGQVNFFWLKDSLTTPCRFNECWRRWPMGWWNIRKHQILGPKYYSKMDVSRGRAAYLLSYMINLSFPLTFITFFLIFPDFHSTAVEMLLLIMKLWRGKGSVTDQWDHESTNTLMALLSGLERYLISLHRPFGSQLPWANRLSSLGSYFLIYETKTPIWICLAGSILYQHICHTAVFGRLKTRETLNFSATILLTFAGMRISSHQEIHSRQIEMTQVAN